MTPMHAHRLSTSVALAVLLGGVTLSADRVKLRTGQTVNGTVTSQDATTVHVALANDRRAQFPMTEVASIEFAPRAEPAPPPSPGSRPAPVTVPAQTTLSVRLTEAIDVDAATLGTTFKAVMDDPVMVGGTVVIPRGARVTLQAVHVQQSGKIKGSDKVTLKANTIAFGGVSYEIASTYVESKGKGEGRRSARKIGGGVGLGALVGGIAGGGEGAAIGAAVGAATGAVVASQGEEHLTLPAETRIQFQLAAAVTVRP
jgi:hypothetical protein